jgi:ribosomal protein L11 methyltransferase
MKNFIKIEIECTSIEDSDILMVTLSENDYYAFEQSENDLIAYIKEEDYDKVKLKKMVGKNRSYEYSRIEDKNWNGEWESRFCPVTINNFAGIRASFHQPLENVAHEIIITPKMSFGTGHHATTFLMIELMEKINFSNKKVLDFGTGTGVLAILAEKLGASSVLAIDYDEWSVKNATENIEKNECKRIIMEERNNIIGVSYVDVILANINFNVLAENAGNLSLLLKRRDRLLVSGFLVSDENNITSVFVENGFTKKQMSQKEGWIALMFEKH